MTREEAIDILRCRTDGDAVEALEMAIQALEQEPSVSKKPNNCEMRDATPEEREAIAKYIKSISKATGVAFDEEQEQLDFVQPHKRIPVTLTVQKEKTCDGCLFQQYPRITVCQECSRYYSDNYVKE